MRGIAQAFNSRYLPDNKPVYYDTKTQEFLWQYENGGLSIVGNNLSQHRESLENIVATLSYRISALESKLDEISKEDK